jgi:hypothetical protein
MQIRCYVAISLALASGGCWSNRSVITVTPRATNQEYALRFNKAFVARETDGDYHVVLIDDGVPDESPSAPGQPLKPSSNPRPKQLVHIRILWRPMRGTKPDHPSATNSTIDWYVVGDTPESKGDYLEYRGAGFVVLHSSGDLATIDIRSASFDRATARGNMVDPLGASRLTGIIHGRMSRARVDDALALVQSLPTGAMGEQPRAKITPGQ